MTCGLLDHKLLVVKYMKNKKNAGVTLLELIIAVVIMALVTFPILGLYSTSVRLNATGHNITGASFTAQLVMEEMIGLPRGNAATPNSILGRTTPPNNITHPNGYTVIATSVVFNPVTEPVLRDLVRVTVDVYELGGDVGDRILCTQTNYILARP
jgi:prepilin-type N-terminal cleavage/methylation domain-containing protein